jgi:hypothetical protein
VLLVGALTLITYLSKLQRESLLSLVRALDDTHPPRGELIEASK